MKASGALCAVALAAVGLSGCDRNDLAQPARDHRSVEAVAAPSRDAARPAPASTAGVRQIAGRPMWSDSRRYSAEENAAYQFGQHAVELEAADLDDFLAKAHRFVNQPPASAVSLTRANGDRLIYDAQSGLFGVARADGAPRTVFKPRDGEAYWETQVRENGGAAGAARRTNAGGG